MTAQSLLLSHVRPDSRVLAITSFTTGDPFLDSIMVKQLPFFLSARYRVDNADLPGSFQRFEALRAEIHRLPYPFDLVFADPYHNYQFSKATFEFALSVAKPDARIICHDCMPPVEHTAPDYVEGCWCGVTYAAFRDVALTTGRPWHVIDDDMGIGVLGPEEGLTHNPETVLDAQWRAADLAGKMELYRAYPREVMRVVSAAIEG